MGEVVDQGLGDALTEIVGIGISTHPLVKSLTAIHSIWCGSGLTALGVPLEPLQIGTNVGGVVVAQITVFLQSLMDDFFEFRRNVRIHPHRGYRWTLQNSRPRQHFNASTIF